FLTQKLLFLPGPAQILHPPAEPGAGGRSDLSFLPPRPRINMAVLSAPLALKGALHRWAYQGEPGRDLRIHLLRGIAVLAMVIDHIAGPSRLYLLTGGNRFYTSAAEGFIFLSGLTVGLVYRRIAEQQGLPTAIHRLLTRAWTLYVLALGLTLVMLPVS